MGKKVKDFTASALVNFSIFTTGLAVGVGLTFILVDYEEGIAILFGILGTLILVAAIGFGVWVGFAFTRHGAKIANDTHAINDSWDSRKFETMQKILSLGVKQLPQAPEQSETFSQSWLPQVTEFGGRK
jgi:hypothetical protein